MRPQRTRWDHPFSDQVVDPSASHWSNPLKQLTGSRRCLTVAATAILVAAVLAPGDSWSFPGDPVSVPDRVTVRPADTGVARREPGHGVGFSPLRQFHPRVRGTPGARLRRPRVPRADGCLSAHWPGRTSNPWKGNSSGRSSTRRRQRYLATGKKVAFRITCYEGDDHQPSATPKWVRDAGAKGYELGKCWEPDYDDPIYLAKLDRFLAAFGSRYDGNPNVAFVDVGTLGIWGEGHPLAHDYGIATAMRHMDMHRKHFPHTLLAAGDDFAHNFTDDDLTRVSRVTASLAFSIPENARGRTFAVFAGLWIPGDATRPEARLLPSNGAPIDVWRSAS